MVRIAKELAAGAFAGRLDSEYYHLSWIVWGGGGLVHNGSCRPVADLDAAIELRVRFSWHWSGDKAETALKKRIRRPWI
jgi:hypothetical protein